MTITNFLVMIGEGGNMEILEIFKKYLDSVHDYYCLFKGAVIKEQINILKWLTEYENQILSKTDCFNHIVAKKSYAYLKWLYDNFEIVIDHNTYINAHSNPDINVIIWIRSITIIPLSETNKSNAFKNARYNSIDAIKLFPEYSCNSRLVDAMLPIIMKEQKLDIYEHVKPHIDIFQSKLFEYCMGPHITVENLRYIFGDRIYNVNITKLIKNNNYDVVKYILNDIQINCRDFNKYLNCCTTVKMYAILMDLATVNY